MGLHNELENERKVSADADTGPHAAARAAQTRIERSMDWYEPPALALDEAGVIERCSESCEELFGYASLDLVKQHISRLFPQLSGHKLVMDGRLNPMLDFLCHCGHLFQGQNRHGDTFKSELNFVRLEHGGRRSLRLIVRPLKNEQVPGNREKANREQANREQAA